MWEVIAAACDWRKILRRLWAGRARAFKRLAQVLKESDDNRYNTRGLREWAWGSSLIRESRMKWCLL